MLFVTLTLGLCDPRLLSYFSWAKHAQPATSLEGKVLRVQQFSEIIKLLCLFFLEH